VGCIFELENYGFIWVCVNLFFYHIGNYLSLHILSFSESFWAFWVFIEEEITIVTIIATHQGVEKLIDGDEPSNPKYVCLFEAK